MDSTSTIKLDVAYNNAPPVVYAKQGDSGTRLISATLLEQGAALTIPAGTTARIRVCKPDKTVAFNDGTISGNVVTVELTQQILAVAGTAAAEIGLYQGESLLSSFLFYIYIERSAVPDDYIESTDEFGALEEALAKAEAADAAAERASDSADAADTAADRAEAAASAVGDEIDGIIWKDEDNDASVLVKFRIRNGAPYADIYDIGGA